MGVVRLHKYGGRLEVYGGNGGNGELEKRGELLESFTKAESKAA